MENPQDKKGHKTTYTCLIQQWSEWVLEICSSTTFYLLTYWLTCDTAVDYGGERQITLVGMWLDWKWRECSGTGHKPPPRDWPWTAVFYILLRTSTGTTVIQHYDRLLCRQEEPSKMLKTGLKTESSVSVSSRTFLLGGPDARILLSESTWRPEFDSRSVSQSE